jgi:hypothetical protein
VLSEAVRTARLVQSADPFRELREDQKRQELEGTGAIVIPIFCIPIHSITPSAFSKYKKVIILLQFRILLIHASKAEATEWRPSKM